MSEHKPPTKIELAQWEKYGSCAGNDAVQRMVSEIRILWAVKNRQSLHLKEMEKDCVMLQKKLVDIGVIVLDTLGVDVPPSPALRPGSWQCSCSMWNFPSHDNCDNCGMLRD